MLVDLAAHADLFHTAIGVAYADLAIGGHRETWPVRSPRFRAWLRRRYYEATADALSATALNAALNLLEARAQFDGPERTVHVRVAEHEPHLSRSCRPGLACGRHWARRMERGWGTAGALPPASGLAAPADPTAGRGAWRTQVVPQSAGRRRLVLAAAWLLATLRQGGPYPLLVISGEQGSAKTVLSKMLRLLIDPNAAPARTLPREERDLFIAANNGHVARI
jgi:hypothetical protein